MIAMMVRSDGRNVDEPSRRSPAARVPAGSPPPVVPVVPVVPAVWAGLAAPPVEEMSLTAGNFSGRRWKLIRRPRMRRARPEPAPACGRVKKSGDRAAGVAGAA